MTKPRSRFLNALLFAGNLAMTLPPSGAHATDPATRQSGHALPNSIQAEANKSLVLNFYFALDEAEARGTLKQDIRNIATRYLRPDYIQHGESFAAAGAGREGFIRSFESMPAGAQGKRAPPQRLAIMAEADRVILVTSRQAPAAGAPTAPATLIFNMFRIQEGRLAEHWDGTSNGCLGAQATARQPAVAPSN